MAIYERGETYAHWVTIRDRDNTLVDPNTVNITITDPCDFTLVDSQSMTSVSTGKYYYYYDTIASSATYGRYKVKVESTSASGQVGIYKEEFYVMPWNLTKDVRQITGASETKDIDDDNMADICWKAYLEALRDVHEHHYKEIPNCDPKDGYGFNGTNTSFQTHHFPVADINGDGTVTGNNTSCATDVKCWWIDEDGSWNHGVVVMDESRNGEIYIYQNDAATAIPDDNEGVYLDYWSEYETFDEDMFHNAVAHLAADMLVRRFKEADRVTMADLSSNIPILIKDDRRFYRKYKQIINHIRRPRVGGV